MFLLIDNFDSFTFNLVQAFQQLGADPVVLRNDRDELLDENFVKTLTRVCLSPGPSNPVNAGHCLDFLAILEKVAPTIPVLGVCLGHQTLGYFAGASVVVNSRIMHGKTSLVRHHGDGLFTGVVNPVEVCRYHSLVVEADKAPDKLRVTADTDQGEVMGLAYTDRPWVGLQFHPESILTPDGPAMLKNFLDMNP